MKHLIQRKAMQVLLFCLITMATLGARAAGAHPSDNNAPPKLNLSITIPEALQSQIIRQDFENECIFSLKTSSNSAAFLFSVTRIPNDQWMTVKNQISNYKIIENKDDYITFLQKTSESKIKGSSALQYQQALQSIDGIISTIHLD